jgi:hypothetical protein
MLYAEGGGVKTRGNRDEYDTFQLNDVVPIVAKNVSKVNKLLSYISIYIKHAFVRW